MYQINNQSVDVKAIYPHTRNWIFVPFKADRSITEQHIALTVRKQNIYLHDETAISITGLCQINSIITVPGIATELFFHCWLLSVKTVALLMPLFSTIENNPNKVYYFVTKKVLRDESEHWIDELSEFLTGRFSPDDMDKIITDTHPTRTNAFNKPDVVDVVAEDFLKICWTTPPCSVYSCTETDSTQDLTVSGITDNNKSPAKQASHALEEKDWD
eukprot:3701828-Ditylum_brightwellii.AAC.1